MFKYQKTKRYFAQFPEGFESLAMEEIKSLGAKQSKPGFRGVRFSADPAVLYRIIYESRLLTRVLAPLVTFTCRDRDDLYREGRSVDWASIFSVGNTFAVSANISENKQIIHSNFAALCLKDAVADFFRSKSGARPNVDKVHPDVWLNLHIIKDKGTISLDVSGGSLHRRGYRHETVEAPIQETLAAAMVALSGWSGEKSVYDPMCGSGTLLCEAVMKTCRIPAGFFKKQFGFSYLPDFDQRLWTTIKKQTDEKMTALPKGLVAGSDIDPRAVFAARVNCRSLPGGRVVRIVEKDFKDIPSLEDRLILCNPPYGIRLKTPDELGAFYQGFGAFLKQRCKGSQAVIYFGNREMLKWIGLKPAWKKPIRNAGLDGRIARFDLY